MLALTTTVTKETIMAIDTLHADSFQAINRGQARPVAAARVLSQFDRRELEGFISVAIGFLDAIDGDADEEANGDELDGSSIEEDIPSEHALGMPGIGPGCPVSDPGEDGHDAEREEGVAVPRNAYDVDQRVTPPGLYVGYRPWDTDRNTFAGEAQ